MWLYSNQSCLIFLYCWWASHAAKVDDHWWLWNTVQEETFQQLLWMSQSSTVLETWLITSMNSIYWLYVSNMNHSDIYIYSSIQKHSLKPYAYIHTCNYASIYNISHINHSKRRSALGPSEGGLLRAWAIHRAAAQCLGKLFLTQHDVSPVVCLQYSIP